jgi:inosose dehydratase
MEERPVPAHALDRALQNGFNHGRSLDERLAGAPISWGVCEVPGWGPMLPVERVLSEMASLGLNGTELGAPGFLPDDPGELKQTLARHDLKLVGGFVPLVLHESKPSTITRAHNLAHDAATLLSEAGAEVFVLALVQDEAWTPPNDLDDQGWRRLAAQIDEVTSLVADNGLTVALHPHAGTLVERADQVQRALDLFDVGWCLDTGHLLIGGVDPVAFAHEHGDRVVHVHLKDVDAAIASELRSGSCSLLEATSRGLFVPLGEGDARIGRVLDALNEHRYEGWLVLEQDTAITEDEPTVGSGPMLDQRRSIEFLHNSARSTQEVNE